MVTRRKYWYLAAAMLLLIAVPLYADETEKTHETYHILQKGFIQVEGSTNLFKFSGKSIHHRGKLEEIAAGLYSGYIMLRFDQISFGFPAIQSILKDPRIYEHGSLSVD